MVPKRVLLCTVQNFKFKDLKVLMSKVDRNLNNEVESNLMKQR